MTEQVYKDNLKAYEAFLCTEEKSRLTIEKYMRDVKKFLLFAEDREITKELVCHYKAYLTASGYAPRSVNSMLASVNSLLTFLGLGDCRVKQLRIQRQTYCSEDKELTRQEYIHLLRAAEGTRLHLILQTICGTGIRISELAYFTVEALQEGSIHISCKGKNRTILVPAKLRRHLLRHAEKQGITAGPVFLNSRGLPIDRSTIWHQMKRLCQKAGVAASKVFPHNLRKLFARAFYKAEKDIAKLADILGHYSIETTRIYIMETGENHRRKLERLGLVV